MSIPITRPSFDEQEREMILKPLETGWVTQGPYVAEFERLFHEFINGRNAVAVSNCTAALHLSLIALGVGCGDKVILPSFTYVASANAIEYTGAEVVFCDIDLKTFNINTKEIEELLSKDKDMKIKALMPVNLFGLCADLTKIVEVSENHNIRVVEDSACGFGAYLDNKHSGTFGNVGCFSFHPRKSITTGEGGMVISDDENIIEKVKSLRDHGAEKSDFLRHKERGGALLPDFNCKGYNYRMTDLQGAIGVCQMKKASLILSKRCEIAKKYDEELKDVDELITPSTPNGSIHGYQSYVCLFTNGEDISELNIGKIDRLNVLRNKFMEQLEVRGIATRQGTHAVHTLGYYKNRYNLGNDKYLQSYAADRLSVALPIYAEMKEADMGIIVSAIKDYLKGK